jgi:hypothetical protein
MYGMYKSDFQTGTPNQEFFSLLFEACINRQKGPSRRPTAPAPGFDLGQGMNSRRKKAASGLPVQFREGKSDFLPPEAPSNQWRTGKERSALIESTREKLSRPKWRPKAEKWQRKTDAPRACPLFGEALRDDHARQREEISSYLLAAAAAAGLGSLASALTHNAAIWIWRNSAR